MRLNYVLLAAAACLLLASAASATATNEQLEESQQYNRGIHVLVMVLAGFGCLMVFVKNYGHSAMTGTYLVLSVAFPFYYLWSSDRWTGSAKPISERMVLSEFAAASALICMGAVLGRLRQLQYIVMTLIFVPLYTLNEWFMYEQGWDLVDSFVDTAGSVIIHVFGAAFGLTLTFVYSKREDVKVPVEANPTSDRMSFIGSMLLWIFWPSFCSALVGAEEVPLTGVNTILSLAGSTLATFTCDMIFRKGRLNAADLANATLAGGVAIGSSCNVASEGQSFLIGLAAGVISTLGFIYVSPYINRRFARMDTCGIANLHFMPGLFGGLIACAVVDDISVGNQFLGTLITLVMAVIGGTIAGLVLPFVGRRPASSFYEDAYEFEDMEYDDPKKPHGSQISAEDYEEKEMEVIAVEEVESPMTPNGHVEAQLTAV